jgi:hypothetical protein
MITTTNQNPNAYAIRLEVLKNAKELVWDAWHMRNNEAERNAEARNESYEMPPQPSTKDVLDTAAQLYDFVQNHGKNS